MSIKLAARCFILNRFITPNTSWLSLVKGQQQQIQNNSRRQVQSYYS